MFTGFGIAAPRAAIIERRAEREILAAGGACPTQPGISRRPPSPRLLEAPPRCLGFKPPTSIVRHP
jgi:hypothetical protein